MDIKTGIFEKLIQKRTLQLKRTTVSLSDQSQNKLNHLRDAYDIQLFELFSSVLADFEQSGENRTGSCFEGIQEEAERILKVGTLFPNSKSLSFKEDDILRLKQFAKEMSISRDVLINAIINYAELCINSSMEEKRKQKMKASEIVQNWLKQGEEILKQFADELDSSDELVNRLTNIVNSEREFLDGYNSKMKR